MVFVDVKNERRRSIWSERKLDWLCSCYKAQKEISCVEPATWRQSNFLPTAFILAFPTFGGLQLTMTFGSTTGLERGLALVEMLHRHHPTITGSAWGNLEKYSLTVSQPDDALTFNIQHRYYRYCRRSPFGDFSVCHRKAVLRSPTFIFQMLIGAN